VTRLSQILQPPRYGFASPDGLVVPSAGQVFREVVWNTNVFRDRRNWLSLLSAGTTFVLILFWIPLVLHFTWPAFAFAIFYAMIILNIHNTAYTHRFAAHSAFDFRNRAAAFFFQNLTLKIVPEEAFVISHHVHHGIPDQPGDPHNPKAGWLSVMFSDAITHSIRRDYSFEEYAWVAKFMAHVPIRRNSYAEYLRWGTVSRPLDTIALYLANWSAWAAIFYFIGGWPFVYAGFAGAGTWGFSVRNFNFKSHGSGLDRRRKGRDFSPHDLSVNNALAGRVAGEWHSNHHVTPTSARNGYLSGQWDFAYGLIRICHSLGLVSGYRNHESEFLRRAGLEEKK
jgi:stearoyl-CoA desaturase (delta-9 desaturase)